MSPQQDTQPEGDNPSGSPSWDALYQLAAGQSGWFTGNQATNLGFSLQLLSKHVTSGRLERGQRGIYRLNRFPPADHEDLVVAWLWSKNLGIISHETALQLHGLSDTLPARIHVTLPSSERHRQRRVPEGISLHFADVPETYRTWSGPVPVTTAARTVCDLADAHGDAVLIEQAIEEGIRRGVFHARDVVEATAYVAGFSLPGACRTFPESVVDLDHTWSCHHFGGHYRQPLPSDWPKVAEEIARNHGGRIRSQGHFPGTKSLLVEVTWPSPGPSIDVVEGVRRSMSEAFSWR